jgi:hypothetical protein
MGMKLGLSTQRKEQCLRVFENQVLKRIFGPNTEEVAGGWGRLHNEELHNLYATPNTVKVIKSRRMKWMDYIAHNGKDD